jgi:ribosomal protein S18 acetylase RimI-like enzyme
MTLRKATAADLPRLLALYRSLVDDMLSRGLLVWDEVYPCNVVPDDVARGRLYLFEEGADIAAAFVINPAHAGQDSVGWHVREGTPLYLDRLAVSLAYRGRHLGAACIDEAARLSREAGAAALRLFVVNRNAPAIHVYEACGFVRAEGFFPLSFSGQILPEYGYELAL